MSDHERVVPDVIEDAPKPDTGLDPLPDAAECDRKPTKRVRKPRKAR